MAAARPLAGEAGRAKASIPALFKSRGNITSGVVGLVIWLPGNMMHSMLHCNIKMLHRINAL
jgi:hypothetical protein